MRKFTDPRHSVASRSVHITLMISLLAALCLTLAPWAVGHAQATAAKPPTDWSFYVLDGNTTTAYNLGYNQGKFDASFSPQVNSLVVLDFGIQNSAGTGTIMTFNGLSLTNTQVEAVAEQFSHGYYDGTGANDAISVLTLGLGTNDSANYSSTTYTTLGQDWAAVVNAVISYNQTKGCQVRRTGDRGGDQQRPSAGPQRAAGPAS